MAGRGVGWYYRRNHHGAATQGSGAVGSSGGGGGSTWTGGTVAAVWADRPVDVLGVNTHTRRTDMIYTEVPASGTAASTIKAKLDSIGIRHIREDLGYNSTVQRAALATICAGGIKVLFTAGNLIGGATPPTAVQVKTDLTTHYVGLYEGVEGLNESDHSGNASAVSITQQYQIDLWGQFHPLGVTVLGPPMAANKNMASYGSFATVMDANPVHVYTGGNKPSTGMSASKTAQVVNNPTGKPIWLTECFAHTAIHASDGFPPMTEAVQGVYAPIELLEAYRQGFVRAYFYELADDKRDDGLTNIQRAFGLYAWSSAVGVATVVPAWRAKPAATSLKNLITLLADPGDAYSPVSVPMTVTGGGSDLRILLFGKRNGTYQLCLYRDASIWTPKANQVDAGTTATVTPYTVTVTFDQSRTAKQYQPDNSATAASTVTNDTHTVSLAGSLKVLTF